MDAWKILQLVHKQVIIAPSGETIDLNHLAVWKAIDEYGIENKIGIFEKVTGAFRVLMKRITEKGG